MDSPPKLSGETLIVHHIPLVHCQVTGGRQSCGGGGSSLKRSKPFSYPENLGLSRTTSLPEQDVLQREALVYSSLIQTSTGGGRGGGGGKGEGGGGGRGGSTGSDDSSVTSSNWEDQVMVMVAHTLPRVKPREQANNPLRLRHNPFLLNTEEDDDDEEEEEEEDGDNLNGYLEDSSFHLHGDTNSALDEEGDGVAPFHLHDLGSTTHKPFLLHSTLGKHSWGCSGRRDSLRGVASDLSTHLEGLDLLGLDSPRRHGSSGSTLSMDCGEQEWGEDEEEEEEDHPMRGGGRGSSQADSSSGSGPAHQRCSCCGLSQTYLEHFPEPFSESSECQLGYGSDSSCNSSDGVLVNFSAIYNKMNNSIPATSSKPPPLATTTTNLNSSTDQSCTSSVCICAVLDEETGSRRGSGGGGAFYLDLHTSPTEPPQHHTQQTPCPSNNTLPQARLVVTTQNYYKLVTCDLSSPSPPSPAGSSASVTSCSDEHSKDSPAPDTPTATQPTEYYLFRRPPGGKEEGEEEEEEEEEEEGEGESSRRDEDEEDNDEDEEEEERKNRKQQQQQQMGGACSDPIIEGQVYVNISPPVVGRGPIGGGPTRPRSRSYDQNLDMSPPLRLGSLERMLSCPVRLSEGTAPLGPPPLPRVTSFAEIARSKRRNGGSTGSPSLKMGGCTDPFSPTHSAHSHSSADFSPILEGQGQGQSQGQSHSLPFQHCDSQGSVDHHSPGGGARESRSKAK
ncbi:unnamed protein product, partial [Coregonus sp. 'balchen']